MSTRGRANAIRAALELRGVTGGDPLRCAELEAALSNCLSCKACTTECPSNVNMALLKAELLHARIRRDGLSWRERLVSSVDLLGRLGCLMPRLANLALDSLFVRSILSKTLGLAWQRPLPHYARQRFDHWFKRRQPLGEGPARPGRALGRHLRALSRAAHRHRGGEGPRSRRVRSGLADWAEVLRPAGLQPGQPRRGDAAGPAQPGLAQPGRGRRADPVPGAVLLLHVRGGLPRAEAGGHGARRPALLPLRAVHRGIARPRAGRAAVQGQGRPTSSSTPIATPRR